MLLGTSGDSLIKKFSNLPAHNQLMIEGQFHFMSPFWRGEAAFLKVDDQIVWLDHHDWSDYNNVEPCKFDSDEINEYKVSVPINAIVKHYGDSAKIEIGTTKDFSDYSECEMELFHQNHLSLFGFDDFMLNIK